MYKGHGGPERAVIDTELRFAKYLRSDGLPSCIRAQLTPARGLRPQWRHYRKSCTTPAPQAHPPQRHRPSSGRPEAPSATEAKQAASALVFGGDVVLQTRGRDK